MLLRQKAERNNNNINMKQQQQSNNELLGFLFGRSGRVVFAG
jgi:hypothetical protein